MSGKFCAWPRGVPLRNKGRQLSGEPAHGKWVPWQGLSRNSRLCTACVLHTGGKCVQGLLVALVERTGDNINAHQGGVGGKQMMAVPRTEEHAV